MWRLWSRRTVGTAPDGWWPHLPPERGEAYDKSPPRLHTTRWADHNGDGDDNLFSQLVGARVHWSRLWIKSIRGAKTLFSHGSAVKPLHMGEKFLFLKFMASLAVPLFDTIFNTRWCSNHDLDKEHCQTTWERKGEGNQELPECIFHCYGGGRVLYKEAKEVVKCFFTRIQPLITFNWQMMKISML